MTELLQLLTAARSLESQVSIQDAVNQHAQVLNQQAQIINQQAREIDTLQQQVSLLQGGQDFIFWTGMISILALAAALALCIALLERKLKRLMP